MSNVFENLSEYEKKVLTRELGEKDGIEQSPVHVLYGGGLLMSQAVTNAALSTQSILRLLVKILEDDRLRASAYDKMVKVHIQSLVQHAREYRGGGVSFEDTPYILEEYGPGEIVLRLEGN